MEKLEIRIECEGAATLSISQLHEMQGELKSLSELDYERLKQQILTEGFSFTLHVWREPEQGKYFILDGHQRIRTLRKLIVDGYFCPDLPVSFVHAESYESAKRKLLGAASQYGKVESQGLYEYLDGMSIDIDYLKKHTNLRDVDYARFDEEYFKDLPQPETTVLNGVEVEIATSSSTENSNSSGGDKSDFSDGVQNPTGDDSHRAIYLKLPIQIADQFQAQLDRFNHVLFPEEKDLSQVYPGTAIQAMVQHLAQIEDGKLI